jgi:hypothetical protein
LSGQDEDGLAVGWNFSGRSAGLWAWALAGHDQFREMRRHVLAFVFDGAGDRDDLRFQRGLRAACASSVGISSACHFNAADKIQKNFNPSQGK